MREDLPGRWEQHSKTVMILEAVRGLSQNSQSSSGLGSGNDGFAESFPAWVAATIIPAFLGLSLLTWLGKLVKARYLAAFALGIFLWFFLDTIGGSANLDVNEGFNGGAAQAGTVVIFVIGALLLFLVDRNRNVLLDSSILGRYGMTIPLLVAVAVGIHGLGEGAAFGATAYSTTSADLLDAFGGLTAGVAYVLHKGLEPMMIGACYWVYSREHRRNTAGRVRDLALLSLVFAIPSLLGAITGYLVSYETTLLFALGTGTSIYAAIRLAAPLFSPVVTASPGTL